MQFVNEIWPYYKKKGLIEKFFKNYYLKTSSWSFYIRKELSTTSIGKWSFFNQASYMRQLISTIKICSNQHADLLGFKKGLVCSRSHFS